jgi:hypothetical protein
MHVFVEMMKRSMWQPSFIEMQRPNLAIQERLEFFDVVNDPVVGTLRDRQNPRASIRVLGLCSFSKRIGVDLLLDIFHPKFVERDWTDNP